MSELSLKISGQRFDFFNKFDVSLVYNSFASTFSFEGMILNESQKRLFKPLSYNDVQVLFGDEILLTGTGLNTSTSIENSQSLGGISGYSKTGILSDCEIPLSLYPLQSDGLSLRKIADKLIKPFGIKLIIDSSVETKVNKAYNISTCDSGQTIGDYITELAGQRDVIVTHDNNSNLVFTSLNVKEPSVATYTEGMPTTKISLTVNGQGIHSIVTVQKQATIEIDIPGVKTVTNEMVSKYRPTVKKQTSGDNNDTESSAEGVRASELRSISLVIETDRWKWTDGKRINIIKPNHIIEVESPSNFLPNRTRFFVEKIDYKGDSEGVNAIITCVLPEVYNGKTPKNIFN